MHSKLKITSIIVLIVAILLPLFSPSDTPISTDIDRINNEIDHQIERAYSQLNGSIIPSGKMELNYLQSFLNLLEPNVYLAIKRDNKTILWKGDLNKADLVKSRKSGDRDVFEIGIDIIDQEGKLHPYLASISNLTHQFRKCDAAPCYPLQGDVSLSYIKTNEHTLQYISVCFLILSFLLFVFWLISAQIGIPWKIVLLFISSILFFGINHWNQSSPIQLNDHSFDLTFSFQSFYDLIIFSIGLFAFTIFLDHYARKRIKKSVIINYSLIAFYGILLLSTFCLIINEFHFLINSPKLAFNFEELSKITRLEILSLSCIAFWNVSLFILTQSWVRLLQTVKGAPKYVIMFFLTMLITVASQIFVDLRPMWVLPLFLFIYFLLSDLYNDIQSKSLTWLIWWIIVYAGFTSILLFHFDSNREIKDRIEYLESSFEPFDQEKFKQAALVIENALESGLDNKVFSHPTIGKIVKQDFIQFVQNTTKENLGFDIDVDIYGQDESGQPIFSDGIVFPKKLLNQAQKIDSNWIYFPLERKYTRSFTISDNENNYKLNIGIKPVVKDKTNERIFYNYYLNDTLVIQGAGLEADLLKYKNSAEIIDVIFKGSNAYIYFTPETGVTLVSIKTYSSILKPITLFSLFFCLTICLVLIIGLIDKYRAFLPSSIQLNNRENTSLSFQIQLVVIGIIILSFIAIATITSLYLNSQVKQSKNNTLQEKIVALTHDIQFRIQNVPTDIDASQILIAANEELENIHNIKLELYDTLGYKFDRLTYGQNKPYPQISFLAYKHLHENANNNPISLNKPVVDTYIPIKRNENSIMYASIRINNNRLSKQGNILDFLGTLMNVYVFLFLIASTIAIAMARSITNPIRTLAMRMKEMKLGKTNKSLEWQRNDELGILIQNYNEMIIELEESAQLLAKTERDGAWREMAKQVAHEIKNPLTPMKLSIQYLSRAIKKNPDQSQEIVNRISDTLIEQIDNLTQIANSFASFGQLPKANNEKIVLNEVIEVIHDLFRKREDIDVKMNVPLNDIKVFADKQHLIRVLNNLVKNAIQSIPNNKKGVVEISLYRKNNDAIIRVSDNGIGIPESMYSKIFTPKFTTKSSGSGLGLAIASNMLEAFNGKLDFDSIENVGSNFYITIPLMKLGQNFEQERIEL